MDMELVYAILAANVYGTTNVDGDGRPRVRSSRNTIPLPESWGTLWEFNNPRTGFMARAYRDTTSGKVVIAYAGTTEEYSRTLDFITGNIPAAAGVLSPQVAAACQFYLGTMAILQHAGMSTADVSFTGHSLGGGLASLMAVYFDRAATAFDQAQFKLSAFNPLTFQAMTAFLQSAGYALPAEFLTYNFLQFSERESNVRRVYLAGEILSIAGDPDLLKIHDGMPKVVDPEAHDALGWEGVSAKGLDLHSMSLLTGLMASNDFLEAIQNNEEILPRIFKGEYSDFKPNNVSVTTLLDLLVERQLKGEQALDVLALDTAKIDGELIGKTAFVAHENGEEIGMSLGGALVDVALAGAYAQGKDRLPEDDFVATFEETFTSEAGAIGFDALDLGSQSGPGLRLLISYLRAFTDYVGIDVGSLSSSRWALQNGSAPIAYAAGDDARRDVLIAAQGANSLDGGGEDDILVAGIDADTLKGGEGSDILIGGGGQDSYLFSSAEFHLGTVDTVFDAWGDGALYVDGAAVHAGERVSDTVWHDGTGELRLSWVAGAGTGVLVIDHLDTGATVRVLGWSNGDLGISLGGTVVPQAVDQAPLFGAGDDSGDVIEHAGDGVVSHASESHRMLALGGNDGLSGGYVDDELDGGDGNDYILGGGGGDRIVGGKGNDYVVNFDGYVAWATHIQVQVGPTLYDTVPIEDYVRDLAASDSNVFAYGNAWYLTAPDASSGDYTKFYQSVTAHTFVSEYDPNPELHQDGADVMEGGEGSDLMFGGGGSDTIEGGKDNDVLVGGRDGDTVNGGGEDDVIFGDRILGGLDQDWHYQVVEVTGDDVLAGDDGNDKIYGQGGSDSLYGGADNDLLMGDRYDDIVGSPNVVTEAPGDDFIDGGAGDDVLQGNAGHDTLIGGDGDDQIQGDDLATGPEAHGNDVILAGAGGDMVWGGGGDDSIDGGDGNDILAGDYDESQLAIAYHGNDAIYGGAGNDSLFGNGGNDSLDGGADDDILDGGKGDDRLFGGAGADQLAGDEGRDRLSGGVGDDKLWGDDGDDRLFGDAEQDELVGGAGNDVLDGGDGNDKLWGDQGEDLLSGGAGSDQLQGGIGNDDIDGGSDGDIVNGNEGADLLHGGAGNDNVSGNEGNDSIYGDDGDDYLFGQEDSDEIFGGLGNDQLNGGDGDDLLDGGEGDDILLGGSGNNTYHYGHGYGNDTVRADDRAASRVVELIDIADPQSLQVGIQGNSLVVTLRETGEILTIEGYLGPDSATVQVLLAGGGALSTTELWGGDNSIYLSNYENNSAHGYGGDDQITSGVGRDELYGDEGDDRIVAGLNNDLVFGGPGVDLLYGDLVDYSYLYGGADILHGGDGNDSIYASSGDDQIYGDNGDDYIEAGYGNDFLEGGSGNDYLSGGGGTDVYAFGRGHGEDRIFEAGWNDSDMDRIVYDASVSPSDVTVARSIKTSTDLDLIIEATGDRISIQGFFNSYGSGAIKRIKEVVFSNGVVWTTSDLLGMSMQGTRLDDNLIENYAPGDVINAGQGNDRVIALDHDDLISGGDGNDLLKGGAGNDLLEGGAGFDLLVGDAGNDRYRFQIGSGIDFINNGSGSATDYDIIELGEGITAADVQLARAGDALVIDLIASGDRLVVLRHFSTDDPNYGGAIDELHFADGSIWDATQLLQNLGPEISSFSVMYDGFRYVDDFGVPAYILGTQDANGTYYGDASEATLFDVGKATKKYAGGSAIYLEGGSAGDTYVYGRGYGLQTIHDAGGQNLVKFNADLSPSDIALVRYGDDLVVQLSSEDVLTISGQFSAAPGVDALEFADGTYWAGATIAQHTVLGDVELHGSDGSDVLVGGVGFDRLYGHAGSDVLEGGARDDLLDGGADADVMRGGEGSDTYIVDNTGDVVEELYPAGWSGSVDKVFATVSYTLGENLDWLVLEGDANLDGTGNALANVIVGSSGNNVLLANPEDAQEGAEADWIDGGAGDDVIVGTQGDDTLIGGTGADILRGGNGWDVYFVDNVGDSVIEDDDDSGVSVWQPADIAALPELGEHPYREADTVVASIDYTLTESLETLILFGQAINGTGNDMRNVIAGSPLDNNLWGMGGNDRLLGGAGNDVLSGGDGDDTLDGGDGNDLLSGGEGNDSYFFNAGGGDLVVENVDAGGVDELILVGATWDDVLFARQDDDLRMTISGGRGSVTFSDWFADESNRVDSLYDDYWNILSAEDVDLLAETAGNSSSSSSVNADSVYTQPSSPELQLLIAAMSESLWARQESIDSFRPLDGQSFDRFLISTPNYQQSPKSLSAA